MAKKTDDELIELYARRLSEARRRKAEVLLEAREGRGADGPEAPAECPPGPGPT